MECEDEANQSSAGYLSLSTAKGPLLGVVLASLIVRYSEQKVYVRVSLSPV